MHALISMASAQLCRQSDESELYSSSHVWSTARISLWPCILSIQPNTVDPQRGHSSIHSFLPDGHFHIKQKEGEHMDGKTESCQRAGSREKPGDFACSWGRKNIKRERSASKHHFHNCPVSRPWWAKGSEKKHNLSVGWTAKAHLLFLLTPPSSPFLPTMTPLSATAPLFLPPLVVFRRPAKEFFSQNLVNNRHEISITPPPCLESGTFLDFLSVGLLGPQKHRSAIHSTIAPLVAYEHFKTVYKDLSSL